jgi:hypothetical protein
VSGSTTSTIAAGSTTTTIAAGSTTTTIAAGSTTTTIAAGSTTSTIAANSTTTIAANATTTTTAASSTTTTVRRFSCPAARTLGEDEQQALSELREFRDRRLAATNTGRLFIILYYMHAREMTALLSQNDGLRAEARQVLEALLQRIQACQNSACARLLTEDELNRIDMLLDKIEPFVSLRLRMSIAFVQHKLHTDELLR